MKKIIIILFCIFTNIANSQNVWEYSHVAPLPGDRSIFLADLEVLDSNYINALYKAPYTLAADNVYLYNSRDQGKTWDSLQFITFPSYFRSISFPDTNSIFYGLRKRIFKSLNKGQDTSLINIDTTAMYEVNNIKMLNQNIGVACNSSFLVTKDAWKTYTYEKYFKKNDSVSLHFYYPIRFKNDSIITCIISNSRGSQRGGAFCEFNINTFEYELYWMRVGIGTYDMCYIGERNIFTCGESNILSGGSSNDGIAKSTDGGKTWRRVLDFRSDRSKFNGRDFGPFGLQSIAFKDSLTGVAVGQFGKILYTYDGGESWIYETKLHDSLGQPNTMKVRYAGSTPVIATYSGKVFRMVEDNLAPKPEDTLTISGRVWEGDKGQAGIPVILGYRVTMSDEDGYYKFTRLPQGKHTVRAVNKYFDGPNPKYYYKPFDYTPEQYEIDLTRDTSGIDFNAIDLRTFYRVSGEIITTGGDGLGDILLTVDDSTTTSTADGKFVFPAIEQKRTYELIPRSKEYTFSPWAYSINIEQDLDTLIFIATPITSVIEKSAELSNIRISPNPAGDYIDISIDRDDGLLPREVQILDLLGLVVSKSELTDGNNRVDISNLPRGTYFIKVGDKVEKFVKM